MQYQGKKEEEEVTNFYFYEHLQNIKPLIKGITLRIK